MATAPDDKGTLEVMGLRLSTKDMPAVLGALLSGERLGVVITPNVHFFVLAARRPDVRACFNAADIAVCDSRIVRLLAGLGGSAVPLVPGSDLIGALFSADVGHLRMLVVGGHGAYLPRLKALTGSGAIRLVEFPRRKHFSDSDIAAECADLAGRAADICILGLGAPLQERVAQQLRRRHPEVFGTILCVGGAIDFAVGAKPRAPLMLQKMHLEWLFRVLSEPRRLLWRYVVDGLWIGPIFLSWLLRRS